MGKLECVNMFVFRSREYVSMGVLKNVTMSPYTVVLDGFDYYAPSNIMIIITGEISMAIREEIR